MWYFCVNEIQMHVNWCILYIAMENEYDVFKMPNVTLDDIHGYCDQHCYIGLYIEKSNKRHISFSN